MKEDCIYVMPYSNTEEVIETMLDNHRKDYSFYVCDINDLICKYKLWRRLFPRITPHYAVKCNNHPTVIQVLAALGVNFDCASENEIKQVISLGIDSSRIIFANTCKPESSIKYAFENNVSLMTFDSEDELYKIKKNYPHAQAVIRIKHDDVSAKCSFGAKFGCDPFSEAEDLLKIAAKENINVVGVSFHIGFGSNTPSVFYEAIQEAHHVFKIGSKLGFSFDLLDIGGGYPGTYDNILYSYSEHIKKGLDQYFPDKSIRIISEPGTYFVKSAFTLASCIQMVKKNSVDVHNKKSTQYNYHINDGVFGSFAMVIYHNIKYFPKSLKTSEEEQYLSTVWGPTCNSIDKVADNVSLPKMNTGEWLIFNNTGNYGHVMSSKFNGLGLNKIYSICTHENMLLLSDKWPNDYPNFVEKTLYN